MDVIIDVLDRLQLAQSVGVPETHCTVLAHTDYLLLLVEDKDVDNVFAFVRINLIGDTKGVWVDREHHAFSTARDHDT